MLKIVDAIMKQSGYIACNMAISMYVIHKDVETLKTIISSNESFAPYHQRKRLHENDPTTLERLCVNLPESFSKEAKSVFKNHFEQ